MHVAHRSTEASFAALVCALLVVLSCLGGWYDGERRDPGTSWVEEVTYEEIDGYDRDATTRFLVLVFGLPAVVCGAIWSRVRPLGRFLFGFATLVFFGLFLWTLWDFQDVRPASLGLGEWSSRVIGGTRTLDDRTILRSEHRVVWTWWAGVGWWAAAAGFAVCAVSLVHGALAAQGSQESRPSAAG